MSELQEQLNRVKEHFEHDNFVKYIGAEVMTIAEGYAKTSLILDTKHLNAHGVVQGGVIFSLADYALGLASASHGSVNLAVQANINFMYPAKTGTLIAEAKELSKGRKVSNYQVSITNINGSETTLIANFIGVTYNKGIAI